MTLVNAVNTLKSTVGWNSRPFVVISSGIFVLITYFYLYYVASLLDLPIVIFQNGVTYNALFENTYIIDKNWDAYLIIALFIVWVMFCLNNKKFGAIVSSILVGVEAVTLSTDLMPIFHLIIFTIFPSLLFMLIFNKIRTKDKSFLKYGTNSLTINYFSISVIICSVIGIILSASMLIFSIPPQALLIHNYAYPLYVLFYNATPLLVFLLMFSFFVKYIIVKFTSKKIPGSQYSTSDYKFISEKHVLPFKTKISFILVFMIVAIILSLIPHNPVVNKTDRVLGVDTDEYIEWIATLIDSPDISSTIYQIFVTQSLGDRPLSLILLLLLTHSASVYGPLVIEFMPTILGPFLILIVYLLTKELTSNDTISLISAFLTAVSFQMLIGMYAGLYANWIALIIGYLSFVYLIKFLKSGLKMHLIIYTTLLILTLLSHVYTWTIFTIITGILLAVLIKINLFGRKKVFLLFIPLSVSIVFDIARIAITGSASSGVQEAIYLLDTGFNLNEFTNRWNNLVFTVQIYVGGIYSNFIIFALGLYWLIKSKLRDFNTIFILVFLSIGIIPLLFGDEIIQARIFYDIPFQIPASIALWQIMRNITGKIMVLSICSWMLFVGVRTAFNLYLVEPL